MTPFEELLRMRRLDSRNCDEEAKELLMLQAADRIAALEALLTEACQNYEGAEYGLDQEFKVGIEPNGDEWMNFVNRIEAVIPFRFTRRER